MKNVSQIHLDKIQSIIVQMSKNRKNYASSESAVVSFICSLVEMTRARRILEIGTLLGYTTIQVAASLPKGGHIQTVDINNECLLYIDQLPRFLRERIVFVHSDSRAFFRQIETAPLDLVFIDGDHSFKGSMADVTGALCRVRQNGYLLLHDVMHPNCPGVHRTLLIIRLINICTLGRAFDIMELPTPPGESSPVISGLAMIQLKRFGFLARKFIAFLHFMVTR